MEPHCSLYFPSLLCFPPQPWGKRSTLPCSVIGKSTLHHVAFAATINCLLNLYSTNEVGCQGVNYPVVNGGSLMYG